MDAKEGIGNGRAGQGKARQGRARRDREGKRVGHQSAMHLVYCLRADLLPPSSWQPGQQGQQYMVQGVDELTSGLLQLDLQMLQQDQQ